MSDDTYGCHWIICNVCVDNPFLLISKNISLEECEEHQRATGHDNYTGGAGPIPRDILARVGK